MTLLEQQKAKKLKRFLMKVKESEKAGLKFNIQKTKIMASGPITLWQTGKKCKQRQILFSWAPKSLQMVTAAMRLKDACSLEETMTNLDVFKKQRYHIADKAL